LTDTEAVSPFSRVDQTAADIQAKMLDYLDQVAALSGIQRVCEIAATG
jgi:hypothetical protein